MRELPEVETIRRGLEREVVGKRVKTVEISGMTSIPGHPNKKHFAQKLEGVKLTGVERRGLLLVLTLDEGSVLVIDLGTSGQLRKTTPRDEHDPGTQVVFSFTQGGQLRLVDRRGTATLAIVPADELLDLHPELGTLGLDPVESPVSWTTFGELLRIHDVRLRSLLLDQRVLVGLGDLYVDEILFTSGLRPDRTTRSLTTQELRRLYRSLVETLHDAMKYRGTSLPGDDYVDLAGKPGDYGDHLQVHGREKEACRRCRMPVVKARSGTATAYLCEQCQV